MQKTTTDSNGKPLTSENETVGMKWVIQPKWETPMLNFNNQGANPITVEAGTITMPTYGAKSVPRGMWHQFGNVPTTPDIGVFLQLEDIPSSWLQYHYDVVQTASVYNDYELVGSNAIHNKVKPLTDVVNFDSNNSKVRLGELAESQTIREAVVAVPYVIESSPTTEVDGVLATQQKTFFEIPSESIEACYEENVGTTEGDSYAYAGPSIRKLVQKMQRYILPPEFDFLNNTEIKPVVMYLFEFEYTLDRDDLVYIWQNLAPRDYKKITFDVQSTAHDLADNELMNAEDILNNENLRWMVFKIKQRSQGEYDEHVQTQAGQSSKSITKSTKNSSEPSLPSKDTEGYNVQFNWPYDYLSFVELIKFDAEVMYGAEKTKSDYADEILNDPDASSQDKMDAAEAKEDEESSLTLPEEEDGGAGGSTDDTGLPPMPGSTGGYN